MDKERKFKLACESLHEKHDISWNIIFHYIGCYTYEGYNVWDAFDEIVRIYLGRTSYEYDKLTRREKDIHKYHGHLAAENGELVIRYF